MSELSLRIESSAMTPAPPRRPESAMAMGSNIVSRSHQTSAGDSNTLGPGAELSLAMDPDASRRPESAMGSNIASRSHQTSAVNSNTLGPGPELSSVMGPISSQHPESAIASSRHQSPARSPNASQRSESTVCILPPTPPPIWKIGPCGGTGGGLRDDMRHADDANTWIEQIKVWHGPTVEAIQVYYERNGRREATTRWGGNVKKDPAEIFFKRGEYITCVKGHIDSYKYVGFKLPATLVRSIKFETNLGATFGPYGPEEGVPFELSGAGEIIGLYARSGVVLDAIGVYISG